MSRTQTTRPAMFTAVERQRITDQLLHQRTVRIDQHASQLLSTGGPGGAAHEQAAASLLAEVHVLTADASSLGVQVAGDVRARIDALLRAPQAVPVRDDVAPVLDDLAERVIGAAVTAALRDQTVAAAEVALAAAGYGQVQRAQREDGKVAILFSHESGRTGVATVGEPTAAQTVATDLRVPEPSVELTVDIVDAADAVPPDDLRAGERCEAAGEDAIAIHRSLPQADDGLVFGKPRQVVRAVRGAEGALPGEDAKAPASGQGKGARRSPSSRARLGKATKHRGTAQ